MLRFDKVKTCSFCRIVSGDEKSFVVMENSTSVAFLDRRPLFHGHLLLVPRTHVETLAELPENLVQPFFRHVQLLTRAVEMATAADGSFVAINNRVSQSVPHLHVHIVPRRRGDGLRGFFWPRHPYRDDAQMQQVCDNLRAVIRQLDSATS